MSKFVNTLYTVMKNKQFSQLQIEKPNTNVHIPNLKIQVAATENRQFKKVNIIQPKLNHFVELGNSELLVKILKFQYTPLFKVWSVIIITDKEILSGESHIRFSAAT